MADFRVTPDADTNGTFLLEEIDLAPAFLTEWFGTPQPGDGYRVTGIFIFTSDCGEVFTVYDYKSSREFLGDDDGALSVDEFWDSREDAEFSIGGRAGDATQFRDWLEGQYHAWHCSQ